MTFRKIVCPIDFSAASADAMRLAVRLASRDGAALELVHVWYVPPSSYVGDMPLPADMMQRMVDTAERNLANAARDARDLGATNVTARLLNGLQWDRVVELVRDDPACDAIVMGTHGRTGFARVLLGSVAEKVVRHAPSSVLVARSPAAGPPFRAVLCPVDFSPQSRRALDLGAALVDHGGSLTLLHVIEAPSSYGTEPTMRDFLADLDRRSVRMLDDWAADLRARGQQVITRTRIGAPGAQTLAVLHDDPAFDLVVVGSRGRTGIERVLLGSVAESIVRHASCPVVVARAR
jgi:nucleotide-binding universal stress UspA family protein